MESERLWIMNKWLGLLAETIENNQHPGPRWRQALTFLYTTPGVPIVFYGSEIAMDGGEAPDNLRQMNFRTDPELMEYMTKIGDLRATLPSLTKGEFEVLHENEGFAIFKRHYEDETTVVAINNTTETQSAAIPAQKLTNDMELRGVLNGDLVRSKNSEYMMTIDRDESEIYILKEKTDHQLHLFNRPCAHSRFFCDIFISSLEKIT